MRGGMGGSGEGRGGEGRLTRAWGGEGAMRLDGWMERRREGLCL